MPETASEVFPTPRGGLLRRVASGAFVARNAVVTGDVELGTECSVWFGATIRGDDASIRVGPRTNIQDQCVVHCDTDAPQVIGADCTIGHGAILHGVRIGDHVLVGMGATILGGAVIGDGAVIAAGSLVKENAQIAPGALVAGVPARFVRQVSDKERAFMAHAIPHYIKTALSYL